MGTLMVVGRGEQPVSWVADVLEGGDRKVAGMTASAAGLYLVDVEYPEHHGLPKRSGWLPNIC
jgi:tRNA pseudouridine38-40 synthase